MKRYDAVLFDFDGTVFDTFPGIATCMQKTMSEDFERESEPLEYYRRFCGPPLTECFKMLGCEGEDIMRGCEGYRRRYADFGIYLCEIYDGIADTLRRLKQAGVKLGIASSKSDYIIEATLKDRNMADVFDAISATPPSERVITKKELIETAMEKLGVTDKSRVAMCGDRCFDAEGAVAAGVDFIAAAYGFAPEGELEAYPCVFWAENAGQIADFVLGARE